MRLPLSGGRFVRVGVCVDVGRGGLNNHPGLTDCRGHAGYFQMVFARGSCVCVRSGTRRTKLSIGRFYRRTTVNYRINRHVDPRVISTVHSLSNVTGGIGRVTRRVRICNLRTIGRRYFSVVSRIDEVVARMGGGGRSDRSWGGDQF